MTGYRRRLAGAAIVLVLFVFSGSGVNAAGSVSPIYSSTAPVPVLSILSPVSDFQSQSKHFPRIKQAVSVLILIACVLLGYVSIVLLFGRQPDVNDYLMHKFMESRK